MNSGTSAGESGLPCATAKSRLFVRSSDRSRSGIAWTQFSYKMDQRANVFHRRFGQNSVPQIEDVSRAARSLLQHRISALTQLLLAAKEQHRIEIALHRPGKIEAAPRLVQREAPVHADHLRAGLLHRRQQRSAVSAEEI